MVRLLQKIPTYLAALTIIGCAKGGMTSSNRTQKASADLPVTSLPVEQEEPLVSDINNPKDQPKTEPVVTKPVTPKPTPTTSPTPTATSAPAKPTTSPKPKPTVKPNPPPVNDKPAVSTATVKPDVILPTITSSTEHTFAPLSWEKNVKTGKEWSNMIYQVIRTEEPILLGQNIAKDIEIFCPTYRILDDNQRLNFWGQFFASLAFRESGWRPTDRMVEPEAKKPDPVTKMPVVSEGLLQLSYQDQKNYPFHCGFDWDKDKNLNPKDPTKTILNPYLNLRCGIKIMSYQLQKHRRITLEKGVYWAVLKTNGKYSKIKEIAAVTRAMKVCQ